MVVNILVVRNREGDGISVLSLELNPLAHHIACLVLLLLIHYQFRLIDNVPIGYIGIKLLEYFLTFDLGFYLTFPNSDHIPSGKFEINIVSIVTGNIHRDLMPPKIKIGFQ